VTWAKKIVHCHGRTKGEGGGSRELGRKRQNIGLKPWWRRIGKKKRAEANGRKGLFLRVGVVG